MSCSSVAAPTDSLADLGRRHQNLLRRQLVLITRLEREEADPADPAGLAGLACVLAAAGSAPARASPGGDAALY
ncbi:hypothetical protein [Paractinoplanes hotanensis]|uniref:Uncharacterized protein n=1 Tax=Paractinoplanes hotanensis TaxID=2906497 RepID=A0ABT0XYF0_9ACTN|nr:hypothetical protein [Actinoplanes hotanensis]MCM4078819.1 hypothetical protein [Actinoplanes hotanensis]